MATQPLAKQGGGYDGHFHPTWFSDKVVVLVPELPTGLAETLSGLHYDLAATLA